MGSSPCGERDLQHRILKLFLRGHRFAYTILQRGVRRPVRTFPDGSEQDSPAQPGPQRRKGREGDEDQLKANCDKARELLKEAGYEDGKGFPVVEYLYNTNDNHRAIGEALQNMWQTELGVTVNLQNQDWAVFLQKRKNEN